MTDNKSSGNKSIAACGHSCRRSKKRRAFICYFLLKTLDLDLFHYSSSTPTDRPPILYSSLARWMAGPYDKRRTPNLYPVPFISPRPSSLLLSLAAIRTARLAGNHHFVCDTLNYHLNYDNPQFHNLNSASARLLNVVKCGAEGHTQTGSAVSVLAIPRHTEPAGDYHNVK